MYRIMFLMSFRRVMQYPWAIFLYISFTWINMALTIAVWTIASKSQQSGIITQQSIAFYFFLLLILVPLIQSYATGYISHELIKKGDLTSYLIKPISFFWSMFLYEVPWRMLMFIYSLPVIALYVLVIKPIVVFSPFIFIGILFIPFCYLLSFLVEIIVAYTAFFFEDSKGIENVNEVLVVLFSGGGIPLFAFPPILYALSTLLPFRYYLYDLVRVFQGVLTGGEIFRYVVIFSIWMIVLFGIERILWNAGLKKFTGEGR